MIFSLPFHGDPYAFHNVFCVVSLKVISQIILNDRLVRLFFLFSCFSLLSMLSVEICFFNLLDVGEWDHRVFI